MATQMTLALVVAAALAAVEAGLLGGGYGGGGFGGGGFGGGGYGGGGFGGGGYSGPPQPYSFQYAVRDAFSGSDFGHHEGSAGGGAVKGEYYVQLPDGRRQTVTYTASDATGYVANVQYQGTPHYGGGGGGFGGGGFGGGGFGGGGHRGGSVFGGGPSGTYLPPHGK